MIFFAGINFKKPPVIGSTLLTASMDLTNQIADCGAAPGSTKLTFVKLLFNCKLIVCSFPRSRIVFPSIRDLSRPYSLPKSIAESKPKFKQLNLPLR